MTLVEFIKEKYPIERKLEELRADPVQQILDRDDLPCDTVAMFDGKLQKAVELSEERYMPVIDLLSYCKEDVDKSNDTDFKETWYAYMDNIDLTDMSISQIMSAAADYKRLKEKKEALLGVSAG